MKVEIIFFITLLLGTACASNKGLEDGQYFKHKEYTCLCNDFEDQILIQVKRSNNDSINTFSLLKDNSNIGEISLSRSMNRINYYYDYGNKFGVLVDFEELDSNYRLLKGGTLFGSAVKSKIDNELFKLEFETAFLPNKFISKLWIDKYGGFMKFDYYDGERNWICIPR